MVPLYAYFGSPVVLIKPPKAHTHIKIRWKENLAAFDGNDHKVQEFWFDLSLEQLQLVLREST
jgi:hypothetical protein